MVSCIKRQDVVSFSEYHSTITLRHVGVGWYKWSLRWPNGPWEMWMWFQKNTFNFCFIWHIHICLSICIFVNQIVYGTFIFNISLFIPLLLKRMFLIMYILLLLAHVFYFYAGAMSTMTKLYMLSHNWVNMTTFCDTLMSNISHLTHKRYKKCAHDWWHHIYRKTFNIRLTLVGHKIVDHPYVVGAAPVGANYIFIVDLTSGFKGFGKDSRKAVRESLSVVI